MILGDVVETHPIDFGIASVATQASRMNDYINTNYGN